ncbi:NhaP-type Na+/H+ and K+/H+ antiporter [Secundilactobacillus oryzae JCM 18671]|uniref:NhaP-type Na+/H+ and K+/H+ antiporter n=1 Tax=Secundilactobacillus oryzae JCM 18671 TaxID=1291743 RepID=A0A081BKB9_9LACO|nr:sodium:proton antiporter [Secundilactobacillus oryzae]GAK48487.1 NhaP-type Na+/H+ and K+/H+ antiporter [Secundilactobacillus oryzae JCM 18671]
MPIVEAVILLAVVVLASNIISHYLTFIPVSLIQVLLGLGVALVFDVKIDLETDWFLLLFIAPLLFNDGRRFPKRELWKLRGPIFANAILLVFITTLVGGYLMYLMIPKMPLTVALALAAILSPTDPVAVQSISKRAKLPDAILHLVSGESLINDASGLIAFKYAVAATVTGYFSLTEATNDFLYISLVGLLFGLVLMLAIDLLKDILRRQGINDVVFNTVLQIVTPFIIYLVTEEVAHASGVIAVVAAGALSHAQENRIIEDLPELRLVTENTWDIIIYLLNGAVFVILGIELPLATRNIIVNDTFSTTQAILYSIGAWLIILIIRVIWIFIYQAISFARKKGSRPSLRVALLSGLSGVRGAITMAGVLSIPLVTASGSVFPERSLALFIAAGVIIISLVVATITLPLVSPEGGAPLQTRGAHVDEDVIDDDEEVHDYISEEEAKAYIMRLAVSKIEENRRLENQRAAYDLMLDYQFIIRRLEMHFKDDEAVQSSIQDEVTLRRVGYEAEMQSLEKLYKEKQIKRSSYLIIGNRIRRSERQVVQSSGHLMLWSLRNSRVWGRQILRSIRIWFMSDDNEAVETDINLIEREGAKAAIKALSTYLARGDVDEHQFDNQAIYHLVIHYRNRIERARSDHQSSQKTYEQQLNKLRTLALGAERSGIQSLLEAGNINWRMAASLREYVNYSENVLMMSLADDE